MFCIRMSIKYYNLYYDLITGIVSVAVVAKWLEHLLHTHEGTGSTPCEATPFYCLTVIMPYGI